MRVPASKTSALRRRVAVLSADCQRHSGVFCWWFSRVFHGPLLGNPMNHLVAAVVSEQINSWAGSTASTATVMQMWCAQELNGPSVSLLARVSADNSATSPAEASHENHRKKIFTTAPISSPTNSSCLKDPSQPALRSLKHWQVDNPGVEKSSYLLMTTNHSNKLVATSPAC